MMESKAQRRRRRKGTPNEVLHQKHERKILPVWWEEVPRRVRVPEFQDVRLEPGQCHAAVPVGRRWRPCKGTWWMGHLCYSHHPDGAHRRALARRFEGKVPA